MEQQVNIGIKRIKEIEFFIDEQIEFANSDLVNINFELTLHLTPNENLVELMLSTLFTITETGNLFMKIKTSNLFELAELESFRMGESTQFDIPDNVLVTFLSLSISHSRALLAKNTQGSKFADLYIPIVNPSDVLKQLFGK